MRFEPDRPLHDRYQVDHDFLDAGTGGEVVTIGRTVNAFFRWEFNSCETLIRGGEVCPIDYANACPDVSLISLHYYFPWAIKALLRWCVYCCATGRPMRVALDLEPWFAVAERDTTYEEKLAAYRELADEDLEVDEYEEFCARHLPHVDEAMAEYIASPDFDRLLVETVTRTFPPARARAVRRALPRPARRVGARPGERVTAVGRIGIWTGFRTFGPERAGEAARIAEDLGYGAWWVGGSPQVADLRPILEATSGLVAATGILNVWRSDAGRTAADAAELPTRVPRAAHARHRHRPPGKRRATTAGRSLRAPRSWTRSTRRPSRPPVEARCLAALRPKMLDLARARTAGAHPYFVPVEHTRIARERLGPGKLLAPEVTCVVETDPARGKAVARDFAHRYLGMRNYTQNLLDLGFSEDDLAGGLRPAHRRGDPPGQRRADRGGRPRASRGGRRPCLRAAARGGGHPARVLDGALARAARLDQGACWMRIMLPAGSRTAQSRTPYG